MIGFIPAEMLLGLKAPDYTAIFNAYKLKTVLFDEILNTIHVPSLSRQFVNVSNALREVKRSKNQKRKKAVGDSRLQSFRNLTQCTTCIFIARYLVWLRFVFPTHYGRIITSNHRPLVTALDRLETMLKDIPGESKREVVEFVNASESRLVEADIKKRFKELFNSIQDYFERMHDKVETTEEEPSEYARKKRKFGSS
jgi:hypothetical protein